MALETLVGVKEIGGFKVVDFSDERDAYNPCHGDNFIVTDIADNKITFTIQCGPVKEKGVNGCQVDTMIEAAKIIIEGLNKNFPYRENAVAITKLDEALMWLDKRKKDREKRNVEGTNQV